jgi:nucleoside-triphosphatase
MRNTVVTGAVGAGKSTAIRRMIEAMKQETPELVVGGFCTRVVRKDGESSVFIKSCMHEDGDELLFAKQPGDPVRVTFWRDVFEEAACKYIDEGLKKAHVVVLDEIGFLEKDCDVFLRKVHEALDGPVPVLAALRKRMDMPHIRAIRERSDVRVVDLGDRPYRLENR